MVQSIKPVNQQINYGAVKDVMPQGVSDKLPENIQNFDTKEAIAQTGAAQTLKQLELTPVSAAAGVGVWAGFAGLTQFLNNKFTGEWDKSWLGKIGNFGDKVSNKVAKLTGEKGRAVSGAFAKAKKGFFNKLPFLKTPTKPSFSMAKAQANGITSFTMNDMKGLLDDWLKQNPSGYKKIFSSAKDAAHASELLKTVAENPKENGKLLKELVETLSKNGNEACKVKKLFGFIPNIPKIGRNAKFSKIANKLTAVTQDSVADVARNATKLGRSLPKRTATLLEGVTNGFAGGKVLIGIQALVFAQALQKAIDAPKGEKTAAFMDQISNDFVYFLAIPWQVQGSHVLGSMKYIGMGKNVETQKAAVKTFREALEKFNSRVGTMSRIEYQEGVKDLKKMLKGDSKWYQKPFKKIGELCSLGLERIKPYGKPKGNFLYKLKGKLGGTGRFVIAMFVIAPIAAKIFGGISKKVFGETTKSKEEKAKAKAEKMAKKEAKKASIQTTAQQNEAFKTQTGMTQQELIQKLQAHPEIITKIQSDPNLMQQVAENPMVLVNMLNNMGTMEQVAQVKSPALQNYLNNDGAKTTSNPFNTQKQAQPAQYVQNPTVSAPYMPQRSYIPSSDPVVNSSTLTPEQQSSIERTMARADAAERAATQYLS